MHSKQDKHRELHLDTQQSSCCKQKQKKKTSKGEVNHYVHYVHKINI